MAKNVGDAVLSNGIPIEIQLHGAGYYEAYLMDITENDGLINFPSNWMPEKKYPLARVRFPPEEETNHSDLHETMLVETLVITSTEAYPGWFKCRIKTLTAQACELKYLDQDNGIEWVKMSAIRKVNMNPPITIDMMHVYHIEIPEDLRECAQRENVHRIMKDEIPTALVNYDADGGMLVIISRSRADIKHAAVLKEAYLKILSQTCNILQNSGQLTHKVKIGTNVGFREEFSVPERFIGIAIGRHGSNINAAREIPGIENIKLINGTNKFIVEAETKRAVKEARNMVEIQSYVQYVPEEFMPQLVGPQYENLYSITKATGSANIYVPSNQEVPATSETEGYIPLSIIGTRHAMDMSEIYINYQLTNFRDLQSLRLKERQAMDKISNICKTGTKSKKTTTYPVIGLTDRDSETTLSKPPQSFSQANLCNISNAECDDLNDLLRVDSYDAEDDTGYTRPTERKLVESLKSTDDSLKLVNTDMHTEQIPNEIEEMTPSDVASDVASIFIS